MRSLYAFRRACSHSALLTSVSSFSSRVLSLIDSAMASRARREKLVAVCTKTHVSLLHASWCDSFAPDGPLFVVSTFDALDVANVWSSGPHIACQGANRSMQSSRDSKRLVSTSPSTPNAQYASVFALTLASRASLAISPFAGTSTSMSATPRSGSASTFSALMSSVASVTRGKDWRREASSRAESEKSVCVTKPD